MSSSQRPCMLFKYAHTCIHYHYWAMNVYEWDGTAKMKPKRTCRQFLWACCDLCSFSKRLKFCADGAINSKHPCPSHLCWGLFKNFHNFITLYNLRDICLSFVDSRVWRFLMRVLEGADNGTLPLLCIPEYKTYQLLRILRTRRVLLAFGTNFVQR